MIIKKIKINLFVGILIILSLSGCQFNLDKQKDSTGNSESSAASILKVFFLDIGQGDAILIITPQKKIWLIDGGPDKNVLYKLGQYLPFNRRQINGLILTHPHDDHVGGFPEVLHRYYVGEVWLYPSMHTAPDYLEFLKIIKKQEIFTQAVEAGKIIALEPDLRLEFIWPPADLPKQFTDLNSQSAVAKLIFKETSFLLTGDATKEVEDKLLNSSSTVTWLKSDVLKVAHHGSKYSSSEDFLRAVQPHWAVISAATGNDFGHPHFRTLYFLAKQRAEVLRTDLLGDIIMESDGETIQIK